MGDLDNRIQLTPPVEVDFDVSGQTGQAHDSYPAPKTQARYDLMRSYLIGLLSNQSCDETQGQPNEMRTGTLWYQKAAQLLTIFNGTEFENLANHIAVKIADSDIRNLQTLLQSLVSSMQYVAPRVVWGGIIGYGTSRIFPIPEQFLGYASIAKMVPYIYINGVLIDPRNVTIELSSPAQILVNDTILIKPGQNYFIVLQHTTDIIQEDIIAME